MKRYLTIIKLSAFALALLCLFTALSPAVCAADEAPTITKDLTAGITVTEGESVTLTIQADGDALEYQWYKNNQPADGRNEASWKLENLTAADSGGQYFCYVQNPNGGVSSAVCTLTVVAKPTLTADIASAALTVNEGETITLTAAATAGNSTGMLTQWYYAADGVSTPITGATTGTLTLAVDASWNGREIYCQFTNEAGSTSSSRCAVTVNGAAPTPTPTPTPGPTATPDPPKVTKDPYSETVDEGGSTSFIARAENTKTYKWRFVSATGSQSYDYNAVGNMFPGLVISGGETETINLSNIPYAMDGWRVECVFTGDGGSATSGRATITVIESSSTLSITGQPVGAIMAIDENEDFELSILASARNGGTLSYQWYSAARNSASSMRMIAGATESTYTPEREEGTKYYRVSVTVTHNGKTSEPFYSAIAAVTFTASKAHEHSYSDVWEHNDISHWHQCTCGDHADEDFHSYEWTILTMPTDDEDGSQRGVCTVCGFETTAPIPAGSMPQETEAATPEPVKNTRTGTISMFLLGAALGLAGLCIIGGAAYLIWKVLRGKNEAPLEDEDEPPEEQPRPRKKKK